MVSGLVGGAARQMGGLADGKHFAARTCLNLDALSIGFEPDVIQRVRCEAHEGSAVLPLALVVD
jgi:hypothetical protein